MIIVTGHVRVHPEDVDALRPHARRTLEETRKEDGCLLYAYGEDVIDPGLIRIVERWSDWAALEAHFKTPHMAEWREALSGLRVLERDVRAHEASAERAL